MTIELTTATQAEKTNVLGALGSFSTNRFRPRRNMVVAQIGDSNTNGRPGWQVAVDAEWRSVGGMFHEATVYNNGANGSVLSGWVNNIVAAVGAPRNPANSETANPWDVVEGDPDIIIIKLGTNDLNSPGNRSTAGTEANLRANLATLVDFFLERTSAIIWLSIPQPFHWGGGAAAATYVLPTARTNTTLNIPPTGPELTAAGVTSPTNGETIRIQLGTATPTWEIWQFNGTNWNTRLSISDPFDYLTQFGTDNDAATFSARLRTVYLEWDNRHPRVMVYDSHKHLYGVRCDDRFTNCLDPVTGERLINDGLHPEDLGYRRTCQQMAQQWVGDSYPFRLRTVPVNILQTAKWAVDFYTAVPATSTQICLYANPELIGTQTGPATTNPQFALFPIASSPVSQRAVDEMRQLQDAIPPTIYRQLLHASGRLNMFFHNTGNSYALNRFTFSSLVTAVNPNYAVLTLTGIVGNPTGEIGRVTIWTDDAQSMPFSGLRAHNDISVDIVSGTAIGSSAQLVDFHSALVDEINLVHLARGGTGAAVYELRACNQGDGRWVLAGDTTYNSGKPIAEFEFAHSFLPQQIIMRRDLWANSYGIICPNGVYFQLRVKNGTNNGNVKCVVSRRGAGVFPVVTLQPASVSVTAGSDAVFTSTSTGGLAFQWQQSVDAGVTWTNIAGATGANYTRPAVPVGDNNLRIRNLIKYNEVGFTNDIRFISTNEVTLTVA